MFSSARRRILRRALVSLAAVLLTAGGGALASDDFREFVGNDTLYAILMAVLPSLLLALDKTLRERGRGRSRGA